MRVSQRGITLVEVVVAVSLTGWLALLANGAVLRVGAALNHRAERFAAEQSLRAANGSLRQLLESNDPAGADLLAASGSGLSSRAVRGVGVLCAVEPALLVVRRALWQAVRNPVGGRDSLLVGRLIDPGWITLGLLGPPVSRACPDGAPGTALPVALGPSELPAIGPGSPLRVFEPVELRSYLSSGSAWIGLRAIATGEAVQPLAGPLSASGLVLTWLDWNGLPGSTGAASAVGFRVTALTARSMPDSITGFVALKGEFR
jgi:type II secretory pathway pseudopilin PulG